MVLAGELGIPCVRFADNATGMLRYGQIVTGDGHTGNVYQGNVLAV